MTDSRVRRIPPAVKSRLKVMFLAKHALAGGRLDAEDGSHAIYHHEMLTTLQAIGLDIEPANSYEALWAKPDVDFVVPLLNRGGFQNSEMLAPLLCERHGLPYLGASPIIRGLADDKHLSKLVAKRHDVPTTPWVAYRRGQHISAPGFGWERLVVKPNASSASWGVKVVDSWFEALAHVHDLHAQGHDVIVEPWVPLVDVAVPVIGADGPWMLPPMAYLPDDPGRVRSYEEKRNLVATSADDPLEPVRDEALLERLGAYTAALLKELWPFDYGRFEYRYDPVTGALKFMEVNLSCNLWSKKTISRAAGTLGISHEALVETIVAHSLDRQGIGKPARRLAVAA
ncbi:phosphoribosylglycinamide synthetase [Sphingoaurantiacus capsulatus]|uniref:Phosphoribosylglycinamide synthetase n=1 Tax=Sphingoaurantiacus capsulatus TaxID=1771310 RepID=A0ABV7XFP0_9SPHN